MDVISTILNKLSEFCNKDLAIWLKKYMRMQFEFLGIEAKIRNKIFSEVYKNYKSEIFEDFEQMIKKLWDNKYRELQYAGIFFFRKYSNSLKINDLELIKFTIENKSWWDTVDLIAPTVLAKYFEKYPLQLQKTCNKWLKDKNIWLKRSCIIFQLRKKGKTDFELLKNIILQLKDEKEFFIQKAIGWSLREYSKTNLQAVLDFLDKYEFSPFVVKETLEYATRKNML